MGNGSKDNGKGGDGNPPGTYLVIPYYPGDQGSRPLPSTDLFWMCTSMLIDGSPYAGQQLIPGQTVQLSVDAINYGTLTAPALCMWFWADPTTNFTNATVNLIGQTSVPLARNLLTATPTVDWIVPSQVPEHICLLAMITSPADPASGTYDAAADRHYAQQNIHVLSAAPGKQFRVGFLVGNGRAVPTRFRLEVTPIPPAHRALRHVVDKQATPARAEEVNLVSRSHPGQTGDRATVELAVGEVREVELVARVPDNARPGSTIVLQLAQYEGHRHQPVGGLGVVVRVV